MILFFILLCTSVIALPNYQQKIPETQTALLNHLQKRSIGCYDNCASTCGSCSSNTCDTSCRRCISNDCCGSSCCQTNCNICKTDACRTNQECFKCCTNHCRVDCDKCTTTTEGTITSTTSTERYTTSTRRPTIPTTTRTKTDCCNNTVNLQNNNRHDIRNFVSNNNSIYIPITINNHNHLTISNRITHTGFNRLINVSTSTPGPTPTGTTTSPITTTSKTTEPTCRGKTIVIIEPFPYYIHPVVSLPCFHTHSCSMQRPYWTGQICDCWSGYGDYFGDGCHHGGCGLWHHNQIFDWSGFHGCHSFQQNCGHCGFSFYNNWDYSSCYGCFI